ncbi:hypothetical protein CLAIMM_04644 [Cladophialophora immunda]|nr:hypothetical protein CLAIMM_04644 [Cladophialophora immunda]
MERQMQPGTWDLTLYEKNDDFGGTWYENKYPGCACDIPAHIYTYSWDQNPEWDSYFAYAGPILQYFRTFVEKHNLKGYMALNSEVKSATWNAKDGTYTIRVRNPETGEERTEWAHALVNATGNLNKWKRPKIEGLHAFQGPLMHSARWDESVDFSNKVVGIIGTGSTAIQIVPVLQKVAKQLKLIMRSPTWISPPFANSVLKDVKHGDSDKAHRQYYFSEEEKANFKHDPDSLLFLRRRIESEINLGFELYTRGSKLQEEALQNMREEMIRRIGPGHESLKERLIPKWLPGCRRLTPGDGYLEALTQPNVECIFQGCSHITSDAIVDDSGVSHKIDILVCATGFDVPYKPAFALINDRGENAQELWSVQPNLYMGLFAPEFPNYFMCIGPGGTYSNGSILPSLETACEHFIKCFIKMQKHGIKSMTVKQEACDDYLYHMDLFHSNGKTAWTDSCNSWFKNNGKVWVWPGPTIHYIKVLNEDPRWEDFEYTYWAGRRRFAYLGDGTVRAQHQEPKDTFALAPYIRTADTPWSVDD